MNCQFQSRRFGLVATTVLMFSMCSLCGCQWLNQSVSKMAEWKMPQPPKLFAKKDKSPPPPSRHFEESSSELGNSNPGVAAKSTSQGTPLRPSEQDQPSDLLAQRSRPQRNTPSSEGSASERPPFTLPETNLQFTQPSVAPYSSDQPPVPRTPYRTPGTFDVAGSSQNGASGNSIAGNAPFGGQSLNNSGSPPSSAVTPATNGALTFGNGAFDSGKSSSNGLPSHLESRSGFGSSTEFQSNSAVGSAPSLGLMAGGDAPPTGAAPWQNDAGSSLQPRTMPPANSGSQVSPQAPSQGQSLATHEMSPPVREYRQTPFSSFDSTQNQVPLMTNSLPANVASGNFSGLAPSGEIVPGPHSAISHQAEIPDELRPRSNSYAPGSLSRLQTGQSSGSLFR